MNGGQCMSKVYCFRNLVGVLSDVVDVIKEGPLDVPRRRFRFKQTTAGVISTKTSQQKLLGEKPVCSLTESIRASLCRCSIKDIKRSLVIVRSAVF